MKKAVAKSIALAATFCSTVPAYAESAVQSDKAEDLDILVTSRKRAESVQDIPLAVSVYDQSALISRNINDFSDLSRHAPSVQIQNGGVGYRTVYIRGVSTEAGAAATTGFFFDEVFVEPGGAVRTIVEPNYFDVSRIEILRGPQGTIFGGSSLGGAIRLLNNQPDPSGYYGSSAVQASITKGGGPNFKTDGMVNLPIVRDKVAVRLVGTYESNSGFIDRLVGDFSGPDRTAVGTVVRREDIDASERINVRALLLLQPDENVQITPAFYYIRNSSENFGTFDVAGTARSGPLEQRRFFDVDEPLLDQTSIGNLKINYATGGLDVTAVGSYISRKSRYIEDLSDNIASGFLNSLTSFGGDPNTRFPTPIYGTNHEKTWQLELRVASSDDGPLQYVFGGFYEDRRTNAGIDTRVIGFQDYYRSKGTAVGEFLASLAAGDDFFSQETRGTREQWALFGELSYKLAPNLRVSAGIRRYNFRTGSASSNIGGLINGGPSPDPVPPPTVVESGWSPRFTVSYEPTSDVNLYANVAKGFRPGAANARVSNPVCRPQLDSLGIPVNANGDIPGYKSDEVWNYEAGAKTQWLERRLTVNQAVYRIDWNNVQTGVLLPCGFAFTSNVSKARIYGSETEISGRVSDALTLGGSASYTGAKVTATGSGGLLTATNGSKVGDQLPNVPRWSASAFAEYRAPVSAGVTGFASINFTYSDASYRDFDNRPGPARLSTSASENTRLRRGQDSVDTLGARLGIALDWGSVSLFAENILNKQPRTFWFASTFLSSPDYDRQFTLRPRTIGFQVQGSF